jgi:hypothetical protein
MPDISMCLAIKRQGDKFVICEKRNTCWRYLAAASSYQSYFMTAPFSIEDGKCKCEYYSEIKK